MASSGSTWTVANGQTQSNGIRLPEASNQLVALLVPAEFDGTTITFDGSEDDTTFFAIQNAGGSAFTVTTTASRRVQFNPSDFLGVKYLRLNTGTAQTGATVFTPVFAKAY